MQNWPIKAQPERLNDEDVQTVSRNIENNINKYHVVSNSKSNDKAEENFYNNKSKKKWK